MLDWSWTSQMEKTWDGGNRFYSFSQWEELIEGTLLGPTVRTYALSLVRSLSRAELVVTQTIGWHQPGERVGDLNRNHGDHDNDHSINISSVSSWASLWYRHWPIYTNKPNLQSRVIVPESWVTDTDSSLGQYWSYHRHQVPVTSVHFPLSKYLIKWFMFYLIFLTK